MSLPPGFLDELRTRISLSQVVGRKVSWDMRKSNMAKGDWWAPCPFHQEKSASFHVDDRKGFYYCFGCHAKGDILSFVKETENTGFMEAVEILAREAGMQMPARDPKAAEKSYSAVDCVQTGPITIGDIDRDDSGETVFSERQSLILKSLRVTRIYDEANNALIYLAHANELTQGSGKMSISVIPVTALN